MSQEAPSMTTADVDANLAAVAEAVEEESARQYRDLTSDEVEILSALDPVDLAKLRIAAVVGLYPWRGDPDDRWRVADLIVICALRKPS
ncbi:MAG: hypothetical protein VR70_05980 [Rhodospirillaceae bacterium BRH_c57]|nr:MAG: hypothetical protein VR70_05980 [Rhodospirillaceae bacterium BRH_c57]